MSVDLCVTCFKDGQPDHFPMALAEQAFGPFIILREPDFWRVQYSLHNESDIYFSLEDAGLTHLTINRPCADIRLYESILLILQQSNSALLWPDARPLIADTSVLPHLPPDLIASLGTPRVVRSAADFLYG